MTDPTLAATVVALHRAPEHRFSKDAVDTVELVAGIGVVGDAHAGSTVRHRSRVAVDPTQPNLRQVHLLATESLAAAAAAGFAVAPGALGENVTTAGLELMTLPVGTLLRLGESALVALTGLRNPCAQLNGLQPGLHAYAAERDDAGRFVRGAGVMAVVVQGGLVRRGDAIAVVLPPPPHRRMERV